MRSSLPDGRLAIRLKRPLAEGRQELRLEPVELLRRLATLVPPPRAHVTRFHGIFGPASKWRAEIVPAPIVGPHEHRGSAPTRAASAQPDETAPLAELSKARRPDAKIIPWAELLEHLGLPTTGPPLAPARSTAPPDLAPWQDHVPTLQQALR